MVAEPSGPYAWSISSANPRLPHGGSRPWEATFRPTGRDFGGAARPGRPCLLPLALRCASGDLRGSLLLIHLFVLNRLLQAIERHLGCAHDPLYIGPMKRACPIASDQPIHNSTRMLRWLHRTGFSGVSSILASLLSLFLTRHSTARFDKEKPCSGGAGSICGLWPARVRLAGVDERGRACRYGSSVSPPRRMQACWFASSTVRSRRSHRAVAG